MSRKIPGPGSWENSGNELANPGSGYEISSDEVRNKGISRDREGMPVHGTPSTLNRKSRSIAGPNWSDAKDLEYKGT